MIDFSGGQGGMLLTLHVAMTTLAVLIASPIYRLWRGPSAADRVIAFDLFSSLALGILAIHGIIHKQTFVFDVIIALALLSFLGTVGFAYYLENQGAQRDD